MTADAPHWSDEPSPVVRRAAELEEIAPELSIQGAVAQGIADVSPVWEEATVDPTAAPQDAPEGLSRDRATAVESIREGWLLHRGASRLAPGASPDLALLVGDWCYAAGLCIIADHGSLDDVAALAELIAHVSARADDPIEALHPCWQSTTEDLADA